MKVPHGAILNIQLEIQPITETGEYSGKPISKEKMKQAGLKNKMLVQIKGDSLEDCITRLKRALSVS